MSTVEKMTFGIMLVRGSRGFGERVEQQDSEKRQSMLIRSKICRQDKSTGLVGDTQQRMRAPVGQGIGIYSFRRLLFAHEGGVSLHCAHSVL